MPGYFSMLRPSVCFLSAFAIAVGAVVAHAYNAPLFVLYAIIASFLITGAGNVINDIFDVEIDKTNAPHRAIPSGKISKNKAWIYFVFLEMAGLLFSAAINYGFLSIAVINTVVLFVYSWKLKKLALVGNAAVSYLAASNFIAAALIVFSFTELPFAVIMISSISFLGTMARELIKDAADVEGDKKEGARTLPIIIGQKKTLAIAFLLLIFAIIYLAAPIYLSLFTYAYLIGAVPAILLSLYAIKKAQSKGANSLEKSHNLIKIAMYFVVLAFVLGAVL